jgi:DNA-binding phage protein
VDGEHREFELLASCYRKSLQMARHLQCRSIAFPLISTGSYGFPRDKALNIALDQISSFLKDEEMDVSLVVFDRKSFQLSEELVSDVEQFIDEQTVKHQFEMEMPSGSLSYGAEQERREAYRRAIESSEAPDWEERGGPKGSDRAKRAKSQPQEKEKLSKPKPQERPKSSRRGIFDPDIAALFERLKEKQSGHGADLKQGSLEDVMNNIGETFQQRLLRMIDERQYTDAQVYKKALLDRKLFSKIRCKEDYNPSKKTVLALALALELNLDETIDLLARAGYALSPSSKSDLLVEYCILKEKYDLIDVNALLFHYGLPTLR